MLHPFLLYQFRLVLENKQWKKAANLELHDSELDWNPFPWQKSFIHLARGIGSARTNDIASAENELKILEVLRQALLDKKDKIRAHLVSIKMKTIEAWILFGKKDYEKAIASMTEAADMEDNTEKTRCNASRSNTSQRNYWVICF